MKEILELSLQLFAEGEGDTAQFTGETEADAASQASGEETAPAAGVQDRDREFERLIQGDYKSAFQSRVQEILQKRLRDTKDLTELLADRYGVDREDLPALCKAVEADGEAVPSMSSHLTELQCRRWTRQAEETARIYPEFDLKQAVEDPRFAKLLQSDVDVKTAYEVLNHRQIMDQAVRYAVRTTERNLAARLAASQNRPGENALQSPGGTVLGQSVSQMSRSARADIIRRVMQGEKISL